ncbi:hypothetical protein [Paraburkholderia rhizosphaerae]|uniref:PXPV repeat-containing protein n=1 Tax=Paraburkholderia rhizosphaerae TaxID=480658 RepID=A0A4V3HFS5_9BURK|nr:hypothetical protein [Paraburkholderia rhizosphaerae]TDY54777.1 hypothetical protein BX592_101233 [Paraburkholderia rhizosphaerae]
MKSLIKTVAVAAALVLPAVCFAQSAPQSAVQFTAQSADAGEYVQIVEIEAIGYAPAADQGQPAAATAPDHTTTAQPADQEGYGGVASGMSKSGRPAYDPANDVGMNSIFLHH